MKNETHKTINRILAIQLLKKRVEKQKKIGYEQNLKRSNNFTIDTTPLTTTLIK